MYDFQGYFFQDFLEL